MKIKEVATNEIHWLLPWNRNTQANDRLRQKLGNNLCSYFARCSVGADSYVWSVDINGKWQPLTDAQPTEKMLIDKRWDEVKQEVRTHLSSDIELAEKILTIPNDEYIYYQIDTAGQVKVLITGWGFNNFKGPVIGRGGVKLEDKDSHPVSVSFTIDNEKVPNREFFIVTPQKNVPHTTDAEGNYSMGNIKVGTIFEVIDGPTGRKFSIQADHTMTEYTFDVTEYVKVSVKASHDEQPINDETATLEYHGRTCDLPLIDGYATTTLVFHPDEVCIARFRDEKQQQTIGQTGHTFCFDFMSLRDGGDEEEGEGEGEEEEGEGEVVEPEEPRDISIQVIDSNMKPMAGCSVTFKQGEKELIQKLDGRGTTYLSKEDFATGQPLTAQVSVLGRTLAPIPFTLDEGETQYVLQEVKPKGCTSFLPEILAALGAIAGLVITFFIGGGIIDIVSKFILEHI